MHLNECGLESHIGGQKAVTNRRIKGSSNKAGRSIWYSQEQALPALESNQCLCILRHRSLWDAYSLIKYVRCPCAARQRAARLLRDGTGTLLAFFFPPCKSFSCAFRGVVLLPDVCNSKDWKTEDRATLQNNFFLWISFLIESDLRFPQISTWSMMGWICTCSENPCEGKIASHKMLILHFFYSGLHFSKRGGGKLGIERMRCSLFFQNGLSSPGNSST